MNMRVRNDRILGELIPEILCDGCKETVRPRMGNVVWHEAYDENGDFKTVYARIVHKTCDTKRERGFFELYDVLAELLDGDE